MIAEIRNLITLLSDSENSQGVLRTDLAFDMVAVFWKEFVPATTQEDIIRKSKELLFGKQFYTKFSILKFKFLAWLTENQRLFIAQEYIDGKTYSKSYMNVFLRKVGHFPKLKWELLLDMLPVLIYSWAQYYSPGIFYWEYVSITTI